MKWAYDGSEDWHRSREASLLCSLHTFVWVAEAVGNMDYYRQILLSGVCIIACDGEIQVCSVDTVRFALILSPTVTVDSLYDDPTFSELFWWRSALSSACGFWRGSRG